VLGYSREFLSRLGWDFASGSYQDISAGVYLPAASMDSAMAAKKTVRLRLSKDSAYAGKIRDGGSRRLRKTGRL
jgi:hypothetical protein